MYCCCGGKSGGITFLCVCTCKPMYQCTGAARVSYVKHKPKSENVPNNGLKKKKCLYALRILFEMLEYREEYKFILFGEAILGYLLKQPQPSYYYSRIPSRTRGIRIF